LQKINYITVGVAAEEEAKTGFEEVLEKIIADASLVLFVTLSAGWIAVTVQAVGMVMVKENWVWLVLLMPMVLGSWVLGWILWVWMGEVAGEGWIGGKVTVYE
jgi:hypothetical protein